MENTVLAGAAVAMVFAQSAVFEDDPSHLLIAEQGAEMALTALPADGLPATVALEESLDDLRAFAEEALDFDTQLMQREAPFEIDDADIAAILGVISPGTTEQEILPASPLQLEHGFRVETYIIERQLGIGGQAITYLAHDGDDQYVLKFFKPRSDIPLGSIVRREYEAMRVVAGTPSAVQVRTYRSTVTEVGGAPMIVMEYAPGESLRDQVVRRTSRGTELQQGDITTLVRNFHDVAKVLTALHANGYIHADVKPHNIIVGEQGRLIDFGIAVTTAEASRGSVFGSSPQWSDPRQSKKQPFDSSADIFGLGLSLYTGLTGKNPYTDDARGAALREIAPAVSENVLGTTTLNALIMEMISLTPEARPTAAQVATRLADILVEMEGTFFSAADVEQAIAQLGAAGDAVQKTEEEFLRANGLAQDCSDCIVLIGQLRELIIRGKIAEAQALLDQHKEGNQIVINTEQGTVQVAAHQYAEAISSISRALQNLQQYVDANAGGAAALHRDLERFNAAVLRELKRDEGAIAVAPVRSIGELRNRLEAVAPIMEEQVQRCGGGWQNCGPGAVFVTSVASRLLPGVEVTIGRGRYYEARTAEAQRALQQLRVLADTSKLPDESLFEAVRDIANGQLDEERIATLDEFSKERYGALLTAMRANGIDAQDIAAALPAIEPRVMHDVALLRHEGKTYLIDLTAKQFGEDKPVVTFLEATPENLAAHGYVFMVPRTAFSTQPTNADGNPRTPEQIELAVRGLGELERTSMEYHKSDDTTIASEYELLTKLYAIDPVHTVRPIRLTQAEDGSINGYDMEQLAGQTIGEYVLQHGEYPAALDSAIAETIARWHAAGLAHGDIHSANILVLPDGNIKFIDPNENALRDPPNWKGQDRMDLEKLRETLQEVSVWGKALQFSDAELAAMGLEVDRTTPVYFWTILKAKSEKTSPSWRQLTVAEMQGVIAQMEKLRSRGTTPEGDSALGTGTPPIPTTIDAEQIMQDENFLGRGSNAEVYAIDSQYVLRIPRGVGAAEISGAVTPVPNPFLGKNFGQVVGVVGRGEILLRQQGTLSGVPYGSARNVGGPEMDRVYEESTKRAAEMPQEAYDQLMLDLQVINEGGYQFDPSKAGNLLVDEGTGHFNVVDLNPRNPDYHNDASDVVIVLIDNAYAWKYAGNNPQLHQWRKQIIDKVRVAAKHAGMPLNIDGSSYQYSLKLAGYGTSTDTAVDTITIAAGTTTLPDGTVQVDTGEFGTGNTIEIATSTTTIQDGTINIDEPTTVESDSGITFIRTEKLVSVGKLVDGKKVMGEETRVYYEGSDGSAYEYMLGEIDRGNKKTERVHLFTEVGFGNQYTIMLPASASESEVLAEFVVQLGIQQEIDLFRETPDVGVVRFSLEDGISVLEVEVNGQLFRIRNGQQVLVRSDEEWVEVTSPAIVASVKDAIYRYVITNHPVDGSMEEKYANMKTPGIFTRIGMLYDRILHKAGYAPIGRARLDKLEEVIRENKDLNYLFTEFNLLTNPRMKVFLENTAINDLRKSTSVAGGYYTPTYRTIFQNILDWNQPFDENLLAHEMSHHVWQYHLSAEDRKRWLEYIKQKHPGFLERIKDNPLYEHNGQFALANEAMAYFMGAIVGSGGVIEPHFNEPLQVGDIEMLVRLGLIYGDRAERLKKDIIAQWKYALFGERYTDDAYVASSLGVAEEEFVWATATEQEEVLMAFDRKVIRDDYPPTVSRAALVALAQKYYDTRLVDPTLIDELLIKYGYYDRANVKIQKNVWELIDERFADMVGIPESMAELRGIPLPLHNYGWLSNEVIFGVQDSIADIERWLGVSESSYATMSLVKKYSLIQKAYQKINEEPGRLLRWRDADEGEPDTPYTIDNEGKIITRAEWDAMSVYARYEYYQVTPATEQSVWKKIHTRVRNIVWKFVTSDVFTVLRQPNTVFSYASLFPSSFTDTQITAALGITPNAFARMTVKDRAGFINRFVNEALKGREDDIAVMLVPDSEYLGISAEEWNVISLYERAQRIAQYHATEHPVGVETGNTAEIITAGTTTLTLPSYDPNNQLSLPQSDDWRLEPYVSAYLNHPHLYVAAVEATRVKRLMQGKMNSLKIGGFSPMYGNGLGLDNALESIDPEVGMEFQAHGIDKGDPLQGMDALLRNGVDPNRVLYTMPFFINREAGGAFGADNPKTGGGIILVSEYGKQMQEGIRYVMLDERFMRVIDLLRQAYPGVQFIPWHDAPKVLTEEFNHRTGMNKPIPMVDAEFRLESKEAKSSPAPTPGDEGDWVTVGSPWEASTTDIVAIGTTTLPSGEIQVDEPTTETLVEQTGMTKGELAQAVEDLTPEDDDCVPGSIKCTLKSGDGEGHEQSVERALEQIAQEAIAAAEIPVASETLGDLLRTLPPNRRNVETLLQQQDLSPAALADRILEYLTSPAHPPGSQDPKVQKRGMAVLDILEHIMADQDRLAASALLQYLRTEQPRITTRTIPLGFSAAEYEQFGAQIRAELDRLDLEERLRENLKARAAVVGSSVTGTSGKTGRPFARDAEHDYDISIIVNPETFDAVADAIQQHIYTQTVDGEPTDIASRFATVRHRGVFSRFWIGQLDDTRRFQTVLWDQAQGIGIGGIDIAIVRQGSTFDHGPMIPLPS